MKSIRSLTAWAALLGTLTLPATAAENFKLPAETTRLKPGENAELIKANCLLCHSADYITTQPPLTRAQWTAAVDKMRLKYGAPITTNTVPSLISYLTSRYGK